MKIVQRVRTGRERQRRLEARVEVRERQAENDQGTKLENLLPHETEADRRIEVGDFSLRVQVI